MDRYEPQRGQYLRERVPERIPASANKPDNQYSQWNAGYVRQQRFSKSSSITHHDSRSEEHTSELQSQSNLVCRLLLEKKKKTQLQSTGGARGARGRGLRGYVAGVAPSALTRTSLAAAAAACRPPLAHVC